MFPVPPRTTPSRVILGGLKIFFPSIVDPGSVVPELVVALPGMTTGGEEKVEDVLGALMVTGTGLNALGMTELVEVVEVEGLELTCLGFLDAAGANLRAADHPVLFTGARAGTVEDEAEAEALATSPGIEVVAVDPTGGTPKKGRNGDRRTPSRVRQRKRALHGSSKSRGERPVSDGGHERTR